jgi:hypothetical protein
MAKTDLGARGKHCTVLIEGCDDGIHPKTRLKALLRDGSRVRVMTRIFDSLDEALLYAQSLYREAA